MSLIDIAAELEYVPQDQLVQLANDPNSRYPTYLVLSEVQRRNQMKQMYDNQMARQNQPSTTVAEEAVMELSQGAMPSSAEVSSPLDAGITSMAPPSPQMGMASGGLTAFANGGSTSIDRNLLISMGADPKQLEQMSDQQIAETLKAFKIGDDRFMAPVQQFLFGDKFGDEFMDYVSLVPFGGLTIKGISKLPALYRGAKDLLPKAYQGVKDFFKFSTPSKFVPLGGSGSGGTLVPPFTGWTVSGTTGGLGGRFLQHVGRNPYPYVIGGTGTATLLTPRIEEGDAPTPTPTPEPTPAPTPLPDNTGDVNPYDKANALEAQRLKEEQGLMLAQLGGIIGSSRNLGEIASGIGGLATNISAQRRADRIREEDILRAQPKSEAELAYIQQQTAVLQAQIENMPRKEIETSIKLVTEALEQGVDNPQELQLYLGQLILRLQELDGYDPANEPLAGGAGVT